MVPELGRGDRGLPGARRPGLSAERSWTSGAWARPAEASPQCPGHPECRAVGVRRSRGGERATPTRWRRGVPGPLVGPPGSASAGAASVSVFDVSLVSRSDRSLQDFTLPLSSQVSRRPASGMQTHWLPGTGLTWWWVGARDTRPGWRREGGSSQRVRGSLPEL